MASMLHASRLAAYLDAYLELRTYWRDDPVLYAIQRLGLTPTHQQRRILDAMAPAGAKVSVRSGHNIGKSAAAAAIIWWQLETHDLARIPCTAPTSAQLRQVLWGELGKWRRAADLHSQQRGDPKRLWLSTLFTLTQDRIYDRGAPLEWFAVARTARKEAPEALQGFHATAITVAAAGTHLETQETSPLLFVIDEASGVPDAIFEVAEGALASPGARLLMLGNPTRNTGYFAASHRSHRAQYTALHFRSQDSPLCAADYRTTLVAKFGEGSNVVRVRADGEFPDADDDTLIPLAHCEAALTRSRCEAVSGPRRLGVDVARMGTNRTALVLRQGPLVEHARIYSRQDTMVTVGCVLQALVEWEADEVYIDTIGMGAGVYDRLAELTPHTPGLADAVRTCMLRRGWSRLPLVAVNVALPAPPRTKGEPQGRTLRDHLWLELAAWLRDEQPVFACDRRLAEDLAGELATPTSHLDSSGRIVVESKEAIAARLTQASRGTAGERSPSPDLADAVGTTFAPPARPRAVAPGSVTSRSHWRG
jgi:hypothetical protein